MDQPLSADLLRKMDAYWRAANYLSVGQIYLYDNPLLKEPLRHEHIKPRLLGHWGTTPGLNFIYVHLNRVIKQYDLNVIYIAGPGHGAPGVVANTYLEGTYSEVYPNVSQDEQGMKRLFTQFSFPGGIPSHAAPETPGSIHEGRRAGLLAVARLRRGVRQSRSAGGLRGRRRRGRDRPAGHQLALQQVPQSGPRRRGAADPAPERLQDRRSHRAGADQPRGTGRPVSRLRLRALLRRRRPAGADAPADGRHARQGRGRDPADPDRGPQQAVHRSAPAGR